MTTSKAAEQPVTVSVPEAARILGIGRNTAYVAVRRGDLPAVRIGGRIVVPVHRLVGLIDGDEPEKRGTPDRSRRPGAGGGVTGRPTLDEIRRRLRLRLDGQWRTPSYFQEGLGLSGREWYLVALVLKRLAADGDADLQAHGRNRRFRRCP
jgi:excisionase family DNA binding protein